MKKQLTFLAIAMAAITSVQANEATQVPSAPSSSLTRAEVVNDLAAWRSAGLDESSRGENTPDIYATQYRMLIAQYQQQAQLTAAGNRTASK